MSGLFGTFNIALSGLYSQQKALDVTSHNIANANTDGYSRQRVDLETTTPRNSLGAGQIGTGVQVSAITRVRDNFLDYQTRVELGVQGMYTGKDQFLSQIENIINEPTDTGISSLIGKFFDSFQQLSKQPSTSDSRQVVVQQSLALTNELNHTYNELQKLKTNTQSTINSTVTDVNSLLTQISSVNQEIIQVKISNQQPNDLLDTRDKLLDQLSSTLGINIDKKNFEGINVTTANSPQDPNSPYGGAAPTDLSGNMLYLVQTQNPDKACSLSYIDSITNPNGTQGYSGSGTYTVTYYKKGDKTTDNNKVTVLVNIADQSQFERLDQGRVLWADNSGTALSVTDADVSSGRVNGVIDGSTPIDFKNLKLLETPTGSLKGYSLVQNDVDGYIDELNKFAKAIAFSVNAVEAQSSSYLPDGQTTAANPTVGAYNFFVNANPKVVGSYNESDENAINAGNITLNSALEDDPAKIITGVSNDPNISGADDGTRALAIADLQNSLMNVQGISGTTTRQQFLTSSSTATSGDLFAYDSTLGITTVKNGINGVTTDSYFNNIVDNLGIKEQQAQRMIKNQATLLAGFTQSKTSVSGVSLDEEMANLVQYQHAYQANAKIISTIDQLLDVVVNGLKR